MIADVEKLPRLIVSGIVICVFVGTLVGTTALMLIGNIMNGDLPSSFLDILAVPIASLFGIVAVGPFGALMGVLAGVLIFVLGRKRLRDSDLRGWTLSGAMLGALAGATCPLFLFVMGWGTGGAEGVLLTALYGLLAGATCGVLLGRIGYRTYGAAL